MGKWQNLSLHPPLEIGGGKGMAMPSSGSYMEAENMFRKYPPQLSTLRYLGFEDWSIETTPNLAEINLPLVHLYIIPCLHSYLYVITLPPCSAVQNNPTLCSTAYKKLTKLSRCCSISIKKPSPMSPFFSFCPQICVFVFCSVPHRPRQVCPQSHVGHGIFVSLSLVYFS